MHLLAAPVYMSAHMFMCAVIFFLLSSEIQGLELLEVQVQSLPFFTGEATEAQEVTFLIATANM